MTIVSSAVQSSQKTNPTGALPPSTQNADPASEYQTFLQMLSVQLQNQDPLNPMESADFAVQLATFSSVEQQVLTNDLLRSSQHASANADLATYGAWIGREVASDSPSSFDGSPLTVLPSIAEGAQSARLQVLSEGGHLIQSLPLPIDGAPIEWAGVSDTGTPLPRGSYRFETVSAFANGSERTQSAQTYQPVLEVRADPRGPRLILGSGAAIDASSVVGLRQHLSDAL